MSLIDEFSKEVECEYKGEHYKVRDNGAVFRLPLEGKKPRKLDNIWTFGTKNSSGYMTIASHRVHIIVATAFYGANDSMIYVVDHKDTNRCNNRVENLRWLTKLENILLNPITKEKIEYICGSVENFLKDPSILKGHESLDSNFLWMRTVSKEEAAVTLENWKRLMDTPRSEQPSVGLGEWMFNSPTQPRDKKRFVLLDPSEVPHVEPVLPIKSKAKNKPVVSEAEKKRKEEAKQKREENRRKREEARHQEMKDIHDKVEIFLFEMSKSQGFTVQKNYVFEDSIIDFLLISDETKVALQIFKSEMEVSKQIEDYKQADFKSYWLGCQSKREKPDKTILHPHFQLSLEGENLVVDISTSLRCSIEEFVIAAINDKLQVHKISVDRIKLRFVPWNCYWCREKHYTYMIIGIVTDEDPNLANFDGLYEAGLDFERGIDEFDPIVMQSVKRFLADHQDLHYPMGEIKNRYSKTRDESYLSFGCPSCDGLIGDHYLSDARMNLIYENDDEFVHTIELVSPIEISYDHWEIVE